MSLTLGTNLASLVAQRRLQESSNTLSTIFARLSSGQRINRASDDAAGLAIADTLRADARILEQAVRNTNDAISVLNIADSALLALTDIVQRQQELAQQAASGSYSDQQRSALELENSALANEYQRIIESTEFNGMKLIDGSVSRLNVQVGGDSLSLELLDTTATGSLSGLGTYSDEQIDIHSLGSDDDVRFLVRDFNGDGVDDIVSFALSDNKLGDPLDIIITTYLGTTNGSGYTAFDSFSFEVVDRYDGGGWRSFAAAFESGNDIQIFTSVDDESVGDVETRGLLSIDSSGTITGYVSNGNSVTDQSSTSTTGDFNGDGITDLVENIDGDSFRIRIQETETVTSTQVQDLSQSSTSLSSENSALTALDIFGELQTTLSSSRARIGAGLSRLDVAQSMNESIALEYKTAESRIRDADIAAETAELLKQQILQQAASAVLAQANQQPALALSLLSNVRGGS